MARARLLKPGFFTNPELCALPMASRLLFQGLWCVADREGRLVDNPKRLRIELFPLDAIDVDELLDGLADADLIVRYEAGGQRLIAIPKFKDHQHPHPNEAASKLPAPDAVTCHDAPLHVTSTQAVAVADTGSDDGSGNDEAAAAAPETHEAANGLIRLWTNETGLLVTAAFVERLDAALETFPEDWIAKAIGEAGMSGARSEKLLWAILERYKSEGIEPPPKPSLTYDGHDHIPKRRRENEPARFG